MLLRSASIGNLPGVSEIEQTSFSAPWTTDSFQAGVYFYTRFLVAEGNAALIGYVYVWLVVDEAQILRVAVLRTRFEAGLPPVYCRNSLSMFIWRVQKPPALRCVRAVARRVRFTTSSVLLRLRSGHVITLMVRMRYCWPKI